MQYCKSLLIIIISLFYVHEPHSDVFPLHLQLYVNNLPEKKSKSVIKKSLYQLFAPFGKIIDVVCLRTVRHRGFAHVVFSDINAATAALRQLQGFPIYGKPIRIAFARNDSHAFLIAQGKPVSRKRKRDEESEDLSTLIQKETPMEVGDGAIDK